MKIAELLLEKPVQSTWITNLTYNRPNRVLTMRLSDGKSYSISGISRTMFDKWTNMQSKGEFFHNYIKNKFRINRLN